MRILLVLCTVVIAGCATGAAGPLHRDSAPAPDVARTAAARAALVRALRTGDWDAASSLIAPQAQLRLADGTVRTGRGPVLDALRAMAPDRPAVRATFDLARTRACTGALHDVGMLIVEAEPRGDAPLGRWHAALLWRASAADGALQLHDAAVYPAGDFTAYRTRPCEPLPDSLFRARRFTVLAAPGASAASAWTHDGMLEDELRRTGWRSPADLWGGPDLPTYLIPRDSAHRVERGGLAALGARVRIGRAAFAALQGGTFNGDIERNYADDASRVQLGYRGVEGSALAGLGFGWAHAALGPSLLRVSGDWETTEMFTPGARPDAASWTAWSLGVAGEAGVMVPLTSRLGLDLSTRYGRYPALDIAGYRGSAPMHVEFSSWNAGASLAVRF